MSDAMGHSERPTKGNPKPSRGSKPGEKRGNAGKGRKPGTPNKVTIKMKEALSLLMDDMAPEMLTLIREIRDVNGPQAAWNCVMDVLEYNFPKLARTELTGADGGAVKSETTVVVNFKAPK